MVSTGGPLALQLHGTVQPAGPDPAQLAKAFRLVRMLSSVVQTPVSATPSMQHCSLATASSRRQLYGLIAASSP